MDMQGKTTRHNTVSFEVTESQSDGNHTTVSRQYLVVVLRSLHTRWSATLLLRCHNAPGSRSSRRFACWCVWFLTAVLRPTLSKA